VNQINDGKMKAQLARPPSGQIAHLFSPTVKVNQINSGKMKTQSARPLSERIAHPYLYL
jgi:hypothetical protein